jgi:hypothetical protein
MSQLVKTKRQANFFKRFGAFKGLVEQKKNECQKKPNLHINLLNKLLISHKSSIICVC